MGIVVEDIMGIIEALDLSYRRVSVHVPEGTRLTFRLPSIHSSLVYSVIALSHVCTLSGWRGSYPPSYDFLLPFGGRHWLLGTSWPARGLARLPAGLLGLTQTLTGFQRSGLLGLTQTLTGFQRSTRLRYGRFRCLLYRGQRKCSVCLGAVTQMFPSCHRIVLARSQSSIFRCFMLSRPHQRFTYVHRVGLILACEPYGEGFLGFSFRLAPRRCQRRTERRIQV
jgi:hypothetical protein